MTFSNFGTAQWRVGVLMACTTALLWGILPILLKFGLKEFSVETIACSRFMIAFIVLGFWLRIRGIVIVGRKKLPGLGIWGGVFLAGNYYFMTAGIHLSGPSNAAVLIQLAPLLLVLVGVFAFGEGLSKRQLLGIVIAGSGFLLFYKDNLQSSLDASNYSWAGVNLILAAVAWVAFMVCQKILIPHYAPQALNFIVYGVAGVVLLPFVEWTEFSRLNLGGIALLIVLGLNTVFAYGALAEAVQRIPLTLISVITALNPLLTLLGMKLLSSYFPGNLEPAEPTAMGYWGALLAVTGVVTVVTQRAAGKKS